MKIGICSDLHLELGYQPVIQPPDDIDLMIFVGDIHQGVRAFDWIEAQNYSCTSLYVAGNHEYYHTTYQQLLKQLHDRSDVSDKVVFLENETYKQGGYTFIGATLWTDYEFHTNMPVDYNMRNAEANLNDHKLIMFEEDGALRRWKARDARKIHQESLAYIKTKVAEVGRDKSVVVTHHGPTGSAVTPRFRGDDLNGCFVSDLDNWLLDGGPALYAYGHVHWDIDVMIGETRVVSRQHGYRNERARNGQPPFELLIVELP